MFLNAYSANSIDVAFKTVMVLIRSGFAISVRTKNGNPISPTTPMEPRFVTYKLRTECDCYKRTPDCGKGTDVGSFGQRGDEKEHTIENRLNSVRIPRGEVSIKTISLILTLEGLKFCVQNALQIAIHFHRFQLRWIRKYTH